MTPEEEYIKQFQKHLEQFRNNLQDVPQRTPDNPIDNQSGTFAQYGDGNNIGLGFDNQGKGLDESILKKPPPKVTPTSVPKPVSNSFTPQVQPGTCPHCGFVHPPLKAGQKCPVTINQEQVKIDEATVNKHLVDLRNIVMTHISKNDVKDPKKLFQDLVLHVTKFLQSYKQ